MALVIQYEDAPGNSYAASYWRTGAIGIDSTMKSITVVFIAWKDAASFQAGKPPIPGAKHSYSISGQDFLTVAGNAPSGNTLYDVLAHATETYALAKLDVPTGQNDANGNPTFKSFFDGATQE